MKIIKINNFPPIEEANKMLLDEIIRSQQVLMKKEWNWHRIYGTHKGVRWPQHRPEDLLDFLPSFDLVAFDSANDLFYMQNSDDAVKLDEMFKVFPF